MNWTFCNLLLGLSLHSRRMARYCAKSPVQLVQLVSPLISTSIIRRQSHSTPGPSSTTSIPPKPLNYSFHPSLHLLSTHISQTPSSAVSSFILHYHPRTPLSLSLY
ncbi:hypothetical protein IWZ03DRAFT_365114 [Phyllosticta citriasiana]|uniref:Uncharacterized protein n=1 Tax=Phyllosticta citriasiana TaxID=595635 RepID=A0ABR1KXN9_9PEZI